jgi:hypothetical protein
MYINLISIVKNLLIEHIFTNIASNDVCYMFVYCATLVFLNSASGQICIVWNVQRGLTQGTGPTIGGLIAITGPTGFRFQRPELGGVL